MRDCAADGAKDFPFCCPVALFPPPSLSAFLPPFAVNTEVASHPPLHTFAMADLVITDALQESIDDPLNTLTGYPLLNQDLAIALQGKSSTEHLSYPARTHAQLTLRVAHNTAPLSAGWMAQIFIFGLLTCLFYQYSQSTLFKRDSRITKAVFISVYILNALDSCVCINQLFYSSVRYSLRSPLALRAARPCRICLRRSATMQAISIDRGVCLSADPLRTRSQDWQKRDLNFFLEGTFVGNFQPMLTGLIGAIVQAFLVSRAAVIFKSRHLKTAFIGVQSILVLLGLCGSLMVTGLSFRYFYDTIDASGIVITFNQAVGMWLWSSCIVVGSFSLVCVRTPS